MMKHMLGTYISRLQANQLIEGKNLKLENLSDRMVERVSYNSKEVAPSTLFVCKGAAFREEYLDMAIEGGAIAYVSETDYEKSIPVILVNNVQNALAVVSSLYYNEPDQKIKLIGITGTKGKSTTAYYVKHIFDEYMAAREMGEIGIISSIETYDGVIRKESHITTPESLDLYDHLNNAAETGLEFVVSEISSQALKYGRAFGLHIDTGVFLNISEDHISPIEHADFEDYFTSKLKMFKLCKTACVNLESDFSYRVLTAAKDAERVITFGYREDADVFGYDVHKEGFDTVFRVRTELFDREFKLTMPGLFNVENALAAIAVAITNGIPEEYIYKGLEKARSSGRMEVYRSEDLEKLVIVDYAHNKLSFEKLYETAKAEYPDRSIITVFGCPGKKALLRRRDLGLLAGQNSSYVYITAEDPGAESLTDICNDIAQYVKQNTSNYEIIEDRAEAIEAAVNAPLGKVVILVTGKGNETTQKIGKEYIPYPTDVECAKKYLGEYDRKMNQL